MENALLIGLSRQVSLHRELDVVANNIANLNTSGYKADGAVFEEYLSPNARQNQFTGRDRRLSFVQDRSTWHDMSQGTVNQTGNPLDVAIDGKAFLVVQTPRGDRFTRNGALQINATGELVTSEGHRVIGESGPVQFQSGDRDITIGRDGSISVPGGTRGKLRLVTFDNPQRLQKDGGSTFRAPNGLEARPAENVNVVQGTIEKSNVRGVIEMTRMIEVTRSYTNTASLLQSQNEQRRTAIERLAEVPV
ncbi:MAG: flagellar basal-body rod protein FlgF [Rhizobiales bacterium]|nr:flagellar basal-body rod protein FlgF [Hyphomicrobiales bacterium]